MRIGRNEMKALAELIAHNVFHTECATEVWMSAGDAIAAHHDEVEEAAEEAFGRRTNEREWKRIATMAQPMVELVLYGRLRDTFSAASRAEQLRQAATISHVHGPLKGFETRRWSPPPMRQVAEKEALTQHETCRQAFISACAEYQSHLGVSQYARARYSLLRANAAVAQGMIWADILGIDPCGWLARMEDVERMGKDIAVTA